MLGVAVMSKFSKDSCRVVLCSEFRSEHSLEDFHQDNLLGGDAEIL